MNERRYLQACGVVKFRVKKPSFKNEEVCLLVLMNIFAGVLSDDGDGWGRQVGYRLGILHQ